MIHRGMDIKGKHAEYYWSSPNCYHCACTFIWGAYASLQPFAYNCV